MTHTPDHSDSPSTTDNRAEHTHAHAHDHSHDPTHDHDPGQIHGHSHDHGEDHGQGSGPGFAAQIIAVLWLLTGALVLALLATGRISTYIRTFWHPLTLTAALLVTVLSLSVLWLGAKQERSTNGVGKAQISPIALLLFVPFLLVVAAAPSPLGAAMLDNTASGAERDAALSGAAGRVNKTSGSAANFSPLSDTDVNELTMDDLHNRYSYGKLEDLEGKKVKVVGFISHGGPASFSDDNSSSTKKDDTVKINRYKIFCCAADAVAYSATIAGGADIPDDTWIELVGTIDTAASASHLVLTPESITKTNEPRIPYL